MSALRRRDATSASKMRRKTPFLAACGCGCVSAPVARDSVGLCFACLRAIACDATKGNIFGLLSWIVGLQL
jgi:hypothetical protein